LHAAAWAITVEYMIIVQYLDMILRFCRAFRTTAGTIEYMPKAVAIHYMSGDLLWDVVGAFPMYEFVGVFGGSHHKYAPWLRITRVFFSRRLYQLAREIQVPSVNCF
jgi:hypothetical protein